MLFLLPACVVTIEQDDHPLGHEDSPVVETGDSGQAMFNATLEGTVSVLLTHAGDDGSIEVVPWAESSCGDEYSFGWIFITAYEEDDSADGRHYLGEKVIKAPTTGENEFSLEIGRASCRERV